MSSPSASTLLISPAVLAAQAFVPKLDMFLASLANVGTGADQKTVVGAMKVFKKWLWHKGQAAEVTWSQEHELREWCIVRYVENAGAAWLAPFEANFAPAPPSIDEQLASLLADDGPFTVSNLPAPKVAAYVKPLVQMDLACQEHQWAEAAAQSAAIMLAEREAELLEERRRVLAEFSAKRTADAWAAGFLEVGEEGAASSGEAVETGETAAEVEAAAEPAEESEAPEDEDNADDEDKVPVTPKKVPTTGGSGRLPAVIKRASKSTTPSKRRTQKVVPQYELPAATTFTDAQLRNLLVPHWDEVILDNNQRAGENVPGVKGKKTASLAARDDCKAWKGVTNVGPTTTPNAAGTQPVPSPATVATPSKGLALFPVESPMNAARAFVLEQRKLSAAGKAISISVSSLVLPTTQESGCVVDVVDLAPSTPKGPSWQTIPVDPVESVLCPGGVVLSEPESPSVAAVQSEPEEAAESSNSSESSSEVPVVPLRAVQPNYVPLPTPCVNSQEFIWLGKALDYPISALRPAKYIEAAKEKVEGITAVLRKDMRAAALEMEGLRLRKRIMERSVDILERSQADCAEALEWRQANEAHLQQPFVTLFPLPPGSFLDP
ncbi:hypothetical protein C0992_010222 [Termitomyces sp. T32_za158]|nr:hypothetical protein C0992_010222 [Termitomyces sp. T32_za158]